MHMLVDMHSERDAAEMRPRVGRMRVGRMPTVSRNSGGHDPIATPKQAKQTSVCGRALKHVCSEEIIIPRATGSTIESTPRQLHVKLTQEGQKSMLCTSICYIFSRTSNIDFDVNFSYILYIFCGKVSGAPVLVVLPVYRTPIVYLKMFEKI